MLPRRFAYHTLPALLALALSAPACAADDDFASRLTAPAGFVIDTLPFEVPNARQLALTDKGTLIVGTRRVGKVYAVPDALTAAQPEVITLLEALTMPSGLAVKDGALFVGATSEVLRIDAIDDVLRQPNRTVVTVADDLPDKRHHGWKYLKFGPDGKLYVPVGAPCNMCLSEDPRFASLLTMDVGTGKTEIFAEGIRNTVGFDWHPVTGELWFTDNGRDMLGDDVPAEEINVAPGPGLHFGYPFVHAGDIDDPEFGDHDAREGLTFEAPRVKIQAHSAALGMDFYTHTQFPAAYRNAAFVAEHGSWNRSSKVGYLVSVVTDTDSKTPTYRPFIEGWLVGEDDWGRPNDVLVTPTGELLISDDKTGRIYRVRYAPPVASNGTVTTAK